MARLSTGEGRFLLLGERLLTLLGASLLTLLGERLLTLLGASRRTCGRSTLHMRVYLPHVR
jgi:hypothetical protein